MNQTIYDEIKRRILFFEYQPGEMLNEKRLSAEFGVSRTPVREVFLRLEWEKLVTIIPRAGIMVTKVEFQQLRDVYQIRIPLEGIIGRLAATRLTENDFVRMRELRDECDKVRGTNNFSLLVDIDLKFRDILSTAANNMPLKEVTDSLYNQTQRLWYLIFNKTDFPMTVQAEYDEIDEAIKVFPQEDPALAEEMRQRVIIAAMNRVSSVFGNSVEPVKF